MTRHFYLLLQVLILLSVMTQRANAQDGDPFPLTVQPGDTWAALAIRFQVEESTLRQLNPQINQQQQPVIGRLFTLPETAVEQSGSLFRPSGNLLETAVLYQLSPWKLAMENHLASPTRPALYQTVFVPWSEATPRELPWGFASLEVSATIGSPGQAVAFRAETEPDLMMTAVLGEDEMDLFRQGRHAVGLTGTGAFFGTQQPSLAITVAGAPLWEQPWQFRDPDAWTYQQITLTGTAAQIDQQSIAAERERLMGIWEQNSGQPRWNAPFQLPFDSSLDISSPYGARRSYNGGPYQTYHEGVDFIAYGGTPVLATAGGTVVVAENLFVRGGAVIIDHGLGIYTGYYHLSSLAVVPGDAVLPGDTVGEVGTTGLSTGNHLHWDLLVNGKWVDAQAWLAQGMDCWILAGLDQPCSQN